MRKTCSAQKVCSFYISNIHFATMILPFVNKQVEEKTEIITFFENNFTTNIELVLSKITAQEDCKKKLLEINWKDTNVNKYSLVEKTLKNQIKKQNKTIIIINGTENYINIINELIEKYLENNNKKIATENIKIMDFYEVREFQR